MPTHPLPQNLHRRQQSDNENEPPPPPSISGGIGGATTVAATATATALEVDSSAAGGPSPTEAPPLAPSITVTESSSSTPSSSSPSSSSPAANRTIPLSTVIAACVGAFIGAVILIFVGWRIYKRSGEAIKKRRSGIPRTPLRSNNNARREVEQSKTRTEAWNRLDDVDVKRKEEVQTRERDTIGPMEKLTMFKNSISLPSADQESPPVTLEHHPYLVPYSADIAEDPAEPRRRPFIGRTQWKDNETTTRAQSTPFKVLAKPAVTPPVSKALPTPEIESSHAPHQWESAEVMHYDEKSGTVEERLLYTAEEKGKGRERVPLPLPVSRHVANVSTTSTLGGSERAIQSLIAALDVTPEEVQERLRAASMQGSMMTIGEEDVTTAWR